MIDYPIDENGERKTPCWDYCKTAPDCPYTTDGKCPFNIIITKED